MLNNEFEFWEKIEIFLQVFIITQVSSISVNSTCVDDFIGDDVCDETNNIPECDHDGGRFCLSLIFG